MKNKQIMRKLFSFAYTECTAIKEYLEDMALKGWILKDINTFFIFEKAEPQKIIYAVEVFDMASIYDTGLNYNSSEYIGYCSEAGWNYVGSRGKLFVFRANTENPIPIETDENMKYKTIVKATLQHFGILWFVSLPIALLCLFIQIPELINLDFNALNMKTAIYWLIFIFINFIQIYSFLSWRNRAKRNLKTGKPLPSYTKSDLKRLNFFRFKLPLLILFAVWIGSCIYGILNNDLFFSFLSVGLIVLTAIIIIVTHIISKQRFDKTTNVVLSISVAIAISVIAFVAVTIFIFVAGSSSFHITINNSDISASISSISKIV